MASVEPFFECRGQATAAPTVVLEAGAFGTSADWGLAMRDLVKTGRVCAYDRLGLGRSPDRTNPPTPENIARDLSNALDSLGETQPVILVGHSNGALYVETFATLFPARVAGVLYVDGVGSDDLDEPLVMSDLQDEETLARLAAIGGRMGLAPLVVQPTQWTGHGGKPRRRRPGGRVRAGSSTPMAPPTAPRSAGIGATSRQRLVG